MHPNFTLNKIMEIYIKKKKDFFFLFFYCVEHGTSRLSQQIKGKNKNMGQIKSNHFAFASHPPNHIARY